MNENLITELKEHIERCKDNIHQSEIACMVASENKRVYTRQLTGLYQLLEIAEKSRS